VRGRINVLWIGKTAVEKLMEKLLYDTTTMIEEFTIIFHWMVKKKYRSILKWTCMCVI
jgi:hypothetical protein